MSEKGGAGNDLVLRNYTEVKRIERRLHSIGDWVLPTAVPYRALGLFVLFAIPSWLLLSAFGVPFEPATLWVWACLPGLLAAAAYTVRIQDKSLPALVETHVRFALRRMAHRNDTATKRVQLLCIRWTPTHPAYQRLLDNERNS